MDPKKEHVSLFESLPHGIIGVIVDKVAASSAVDYHNTIRTCKEIHKRADNRQVYRGLSLRPLVKKPLASKGYEKIMEKCLQNNNPEAHYIKGLVQYFHHNQTMTGLYHLTIAADLGLKEAIYILAVLLLCNGITEQGKLYFSQLKWARGTTTVDACWKNIKTSLHGINVGVRRRYLRNIRKMNPPNTCHLNDMDNTCASCFYYKRMRMFVNMR
uniref:F-box protein n=1 Tax=Noccaea caerulescens TaxID=107243 RepID=A0A1J3DWP0_NOCCA